MKRTHLLIAAGALVAALAAGWVLGRRSGDGHAPDHAEVPSPAAPPGVPGGRAPVAVDADWVRRLGLAVEPARVEDVARSVRAAATVVPDESRLVHVHVRVPGWIERVYVETGEYVRAGQPVLAVYSQELQAAQREYLAVHARRGASLPSAVLPSSRARLRVLGMSNAQIAALEAAGRAPAATPLHAPHSGVVLRRPVPAGTAIDASTELLTLADLSTVWVEAEIPERDARLARPGAPVRIHWAATGVEPVEARLDFVSPVITERSRSIRVRVRLANPMGDYRPGLSGTLELQGAAQREITVPRDAVVDTGREQFVYVAEPGGGFTPRRVRAGSGAGGRVTVMEGLAGGEPVLVSGVFLVDSESRLRGSGAAVGHAGHGSPQAREEPSPPPGAGAGHAGHAP